MMVVTRSRQKSLYPLSPAVTMLFRDVATRPAILFRRKRVVGESKVGLARPSAGSTATAVAATAQILASWPMSLLRVEDEDTAPNLRVKRRESAARRTPLWPHVSRI
jgi:hypothetical protein